MAETEINNRFDFLEAPEGKELFARIDFALKDGMHIQNRTKQSEWYYYLCQYEDTLKQYYQDFFGLSLESGDGGFGKYFYLNFEQDGKTLKLAEENASAVKKELSLAGYFAIVSSENMTEREAIELYKSRDVSEKLFRSDKSYLGNKSMRVYSDEALSSKVFIQFIALILRSRIYIALKEKSEKMLKRPNYLTVPAALKELEKIVMIRQLDGVYRLDHAVTATQKTILDALGLNEGNVRYQAKEIEKILQHQ